MATYLRLIFFIFVVMLALKSFAWDQHTLITKAALAPLRIDNKLVTPTSFTSLLEALDFKTELAFKESLQIHKNYNFIFAASEVIGEPVPVIQILAHYSDEPDWGMDQELFENDQYPELWRDEYAMMGGKKGLPSQAFRHMHWPKFSIIHPLQSIKFPLKVINTSMGEAHIRAQLFLQLAKKSKAAGHNYWSARFIACALHYIEDVTNPFHSAQTPTKKYLMMPLTSKYGSGFKDFVLQLTNIISYYHFSFEKFISHSMRAGLGPYTEALTNTHSRAPLKKYSPGQAGALVQGMANYSNKSAARAGRSAYDFFPHIKVNFRELDAQAYMDENWWNETLQRSEQPSKELNQYTDVVHEMFSSLGWAIRVFIQHEL